MLNKLRNLFGKRRLSKERIDEIKKQHLFQFTDNQTLLVKDNVVLGKINKIEKMKPGCLAKGSLAWVYLFEAVSGDKKAEFMTFDKAIEWLLERTLDQWPR